MPKAHTSITPGFKPWSYLYHIPLRRLCVSVLVRAPLADYFCICFSSLCQLSPLDFRSPPRVFQPHSELSYPSFLSSPPACSSPHTFSCYCKHLVLKSLSTCQFSPHSPANLMAFYGLWLRVRCSPTGAKFNSYIHSTNPH